MLEQRVSQYEGIVKRRKRNIYQCQVNQSEILKINDMAYIPMWNDTIKKRQWMNEKHQKPMFEDVGDGIVYSNHMNISNVQFWPYLMP